MPFIRLFIFIFVIGHLSSVIFLTPAHAGGITLSPAFQEVTATATASANSQATVKFSNNTSSSANLSFNLAKIIATDILGRLQFNAPLPQTIYPASSELAQIEPESITLAPNESAEVRVIFDPNQLNPGTNAFLFLAKLNSPGTRDEEPGTNLDSYISSTILVKAQGGESIILKLVKSDLFRLPVSLTLPDFLTLTLKNEGNTHTVPRGIALVTDQLGRELVRGPLNEASSVVLPGSQRVIYAKLNPTHPTWPLAWCKFQLTGYDDQHQSSFAITHRFIYISPLLGLAIPLIIFFGYLLLRKVRSSGSLR